MSSMLNIPLPQQGQTLLPPTPAAQENPPAAPLQPDTSQINQSGLAGLTPPPLPGGISEDIATQLRRQGVVRKIAEHANTLAAQSPAPSAPGAWAKALVGGTQSALAGFQNNAIAAGAANAAPIPRGAPGFAIGMARQAAAKQALQQQQQTEAFQKKHAMALEQIDMMHVDQARRSMAQNDPELKTLDENATNDSILMKPYTEGGEYGKGAAPVLGEHKTQQEVADMIQKGKLDPTQMHRFADGKIATGQTDKYGNPIYEQTFTVVGDSPTVTVDPEAAKQFAKYHVVGANGQPIPEGQTLPGWVYGQLSQKVQNRETAQNAINLARAQVGAKEAEANEHIENQQLQDKFTAAFGKGSQTKDAQGNIIPEEPADATARAYQHLITENPADAPALAKYVYGSQASADKALKDYQTRQYEEFLQPILSDPNDRITSWGEIAKQRVNGEPTQAARAATALLSGVTPQESEQHRKDLAEESLKKQAAQPGTEPTGIVNPDVQEKINKLPAASQQQLSQYAPEQLNKVANVAFGSDDIYKLFPNRKYRGSNEMDVQDAAEVAHLMNPKYDVTRAPVYAATRKEFTDGQVGKSINNLNTALPHLSELLDHTSFWSTVPGFTSLSKLGGGVGAQAETDLTQAANELASFYKGGAAPTESEIADQRKALSGATPQEQRTKIIEAAKKLRDKVVAYKRQWADGGVPGTEPPKQIITPEGQAALDSILGFEKPTQVSATGVPTTPTPESHIFDPQAWAAANPGKDVNAAIALATQLGYGIKRPAAPAITPVPAQAQ